MNPDSVLALSFYVGTGSLLAGLIGAMTGLGGGVVIVPMLTLGFGIDIRYAIGASLVSVIATSSGAAAAYVREGFTNIRVGMFLEIATSLGAILGAHLTAVVNPAAIGVVFGFVLLHSAYTSLSAHGAARETGDTTGRLAGWLRMDGTYPGPDGPRSYHVTSIPSGFALMGVAGVLSGLLGIGSGAVKVLAMDRAMKLPFKVSTTTSNFMIGVTAAAGAGVFLGRGYIEPGLAMPVMLGVLAGSLIGARLLTRMPARKLRLLFAGVIAVLAVEMIYNSVTGRI
ncbi:MAG: sulfite exporter TauE/SafE family protein [Bryobacterales bacterium]|nr:sulfite exporter TauE/SafE family protein [Bryobacterales bacterium]